MSWITEKSIAFIFYYLCLLIACGLTLWCSMEYVENKDISEVSYQQFDPYNEENQYPSLSLCVSDVYKQSSLEIVNESRVNASSYYAFLRGEYWSDTMFQNEYDRATIDLKDFIIGTCMVTATSSACEKISQIETSFFIGGGDIFKCLSIHHNYHSTLDEVMVAINNSIFPDGVRPESHGFQLMYHYPFQLSRSYSSVIYNWPYRSNEKSDYYAMQFYMTDIEMLRRRQDGNEHCFDGKYYDTAFYEHIMRSVGCRPLYWKSTLDVEPCDSKVQMSSIVKYYIANHFRNKSVPIFYRPCVEIMKIQTKYLEKAGKESKNNFNRHIYEQFEQDAGTLHNWFIINSHFWKSIHFKQFKQIKAYSIQSVIGNAGGYIGLLVGLTINEMLNSVVRLYSMIKTRLVNAKKFKKSKCLCEM